MNITILGAGNIGGTLGAKWAAAGHTITFGVRDPNSPKTQAALAKVNAQTLPVPAAIAAGEVILFSIPWAAVPQTVAANVAGLSEKILIDATNNFAGPIINNLAALQTVPGATIFRAFNSLGWEHFEKPNAGGVQTDHFYTGPDGEARARVEKLIEEIGLRAIWVGDHDRVQIVDNLGALWVTLAFQRGWGRGVALKLVEG
ncbi:MAG: NAD(P)-binding domain-containing protein [Anaerolineales bacterium]|nr:NAD(P)-binding domain-containing protein [Anaerolineales bacterium]